MVRDNKPERKAPGQQAGSGSNPEVPTGFPTARGMFRAPPPHRRVTGALGARRRGLPARHPPARRERARAHSLVGHRPSAPGGAARGRHQPEQRQGPAPRRAPQGRARAALPPGPRPGVSRLCHLWLPVRTAPPKPGDGGGPRAEHAQSHAPEPPACTGLRRPAGSALCLRAPAGAGPRHARLHPSASEPFSLLPSALHRGGYSTREGPRSGSAERPPGLRASSFSDSNAERVWPPQFKYSRFCCPPSKTTTSQTKPNQ